MLKNAHITNYDSLYYLDSEYFIFADIISRKKKERGRNAHIK
jgi:hypothetical protein